MHGTTDFVNDFMYASEKRTIANKVITLRFAV